MTEPRTSRRLFVTLILIAGCCQSPGLLAADTDPVIPEVSMDAPPEAIRTWQDRRFGMFIHWGPVSLKGTEIGWSRGREIPTEEYDQLYRQFNPTAFDADAWVQVAKNAGMKYVVITSKHHDGFCLWPSKETEYDIASTPFGRDVLQELSTACRKHGLGFGTYYSVCDWHHPLFPLGSPGGRTKKANPDLDKYDRYLRNQVRELVTQYGPLTTMWFDVPQVYTDKYGISTVKMLRKLQPDIVINNRAYTPGARKEGAPRATVVGDYSTPEQRVGGFDRDRPWETCMTICRQWAWKPADQMKSLQECLQTLLYTVGGDGNLLFNVGPMPDGRIEPRQVQRLKEMGAWLAKYEQGVYATRGGPFKPGRWGASTCTGQKIYLFVMAWPDEGPLQLPPIACKVLNSQTRSGGQASVVQNEEGLQVTLPHDDRDPIATVIELTVDGPALEIEPVPVVHRSDSLAFEKKATASGTFRGLHDAYGPAKAVDDDPETRWATDAGTSAAWLEVDLGTPTTVARVVIDEPAEYQRVQAFQIQYHDGQAWRTAQSGTTLGRNWSCKFSPFTAQRVRLNITAASEGPTLTEFQVFGPNE